MCRAVRRTDGGPDCSHLPARLHTSAAGSAPGASAATAVQGRPEPEGGTPLHACWQRDGGAAIVRSGQKRRAAGVGSAGQSSPKQARTATAPQSDAPLPPPRTPGGALPGVPAAPLPAPARAPSAELTANRE